MITKAASHHESFETVREGCEGVVPLDAVLEPWMADVCQGRRLSDWVERWGSPLNVHSAAPFHRNIAELAETAADRHVDFQLYFARKANKCLNFVRAAREIGCGVDVASEQELSQVLNQRLAPDDIVCTAAVKSNSLLRLCAESGVLIVVDNLDELSIVRALGKDLGRKLNVAIRVSGFRHEGEKLFSRFGFDVSEVEPLLADLASDRGELTNVTGLHFHLDGYCPAQRISAVRESLRLVDLCRQYGFDPQFIDMGGGIPMRYLEHEQQWSTFWSEHQSAIVGEREPITFRNHAFGLTVIDGCVHGKPNSYPYYQPLVKAKWLAGILDASDGDETIAAAMQRRGLQLRCEPGRAVLDGCGMTAARVEFRKRHHSGDWLIGLAMNRTQCRTSSDDFLVDPLIVQVDRSADKNRPASQAMTGYLVGAYCTESELLSLRRLRFPLGVEVGDLVVFPNTAGYLMHFLESRSHQFPLGKNVFVNGESPTQIHVDAIDQEETAQIRNESFRAHHG